jgi:hypothetical protein
MSEFSASEMNGRSAVIFKESGKYGIEAKSYFFLARV